MGSAFERTLEVLGWFETEWYREHGSVWSDQHDEEYEEAKRQYLNDNANYIYGA